MVTRLDGANALLFHMEQSPDASAPWWYRVRYPGSQHESLRGWQRERSVNGEGVFVALVDPSVAPEVEWHAGDGVWRRACPMEFVPAREMFVVEVSIAKDMAQDPELRCASLVRGMPSVFDLILPARTIEAGERLVVAGVSVIHGPGQFFRRKGEFRVKEAGWSVVNGTANGQAALRETGALPPDVGLMIPGVAIRAGRLPDDEVAALLEWMKGVGHAG